jgi:hypothetical protein
VNLISAVAAQAQAVAPTLASVLPALPSLPPSSNGGAVGVAQRDVDEAQRIQQESGDSEAITPQQVANNRLINERLSSIFPANRTPQSIARET